MVHIFIYDKYFYNFYNELPLSPHIKHAYNSKTATNTTKNRVIDTTTHNR